jgi:amino acid transporter
VSNAVSFINFGAFTAFTFVNFCVIAVAIRNRRFRTPVQILGNAVAPIIGAGFDIWLLTQLDGAAHLLGLIWLGLGVIYLIFLTKGFRRPPPEVDFSEDTELAPTA